MAHLVPGDRPRRDAPGHGALWVQDKGLLVAGDMVSDIEIPTLDLESSAPVSDYEEALNLYEEIASDVVTLFPGTACRATGPSCDADLPSTEGTSAVSSPDDLSLTMGGAPNPGCRPNTSCRPLGATSTSTINAYPACQPFSSTPPGISCSPVVGLSREDKRGDVQMGERPVAPSARREGVPPSK